MSFSLSTFSPNPLWFSKLLCLFIVLLLSHSSVADINVLTSIKPLALIAREVGGGDRQIKIDVLLPVKASPHDYPLRVSDIRKLQNADVVLWVGPSLETFLQRPLNNIPLSKHLTAYDLPGMHWPKEDAHSSTNDDGHNHHGRDPHLWLDPRNAVVIAQALANKLGEIDPASAQIYKANAERFGVSMMEMDQRLMRELKPVRAIGFAVYHEGYLHFVERYQLQQLAYITYTPERRPGAKHLYDLRLNLKDRAHCLFTEPYYDMGMANELAQELGLSVATLDPIGGDQVSSYQLLLEQMANTFLTCLANGSPSGET